MGFRISCCFGLKLVLPIHNEFNIFPPRFLFRSAARCALRAAWGKWAVSCELLNSANTTGAGESQAKRGYGVPAQNGANLRDFAQFSQNFPLRGRFQNTPPLRRRFLKHYPTLPTTGANRPRAQTTTRFLVFNFAIALFFFLFFFRIFREMGKMEIR